MKQPLSKLPWKVDIGGVFNSEYTVSDSGKSGFDVMYNKIDESQPPCSRDMEYIVQACNNLPRAIELLNQLHEVLIAYCEVEKAYEVEEFLKSIDDEG